MIKAENGQLKATRYVLRRSLIKCSTAIEFLAFCFLLFSCVSKSSNESSPKFEQYFIKGKQLYLTHCSNCHQKNGKGLGRIYPPLDTSDYMENNMEGTLCLIRNGMDGELVVNGETYNQSMPSFKTLSDLEIAEIATYIYNSWSHQQGIVEVKFASKILLTCDSAMKKP